jgi:Cdc6-like AAA superfamily ATPase
MKIPIEISKLTDSPYSPKLKESFLFEDSDIVEGFIHELNNAKPSTFLVSGYRGVGKTSFVNRIQEKLDTSFININISLSKYEGYPSLIKKLIRHLYLEYYKLEKADNVKFIELNEKLGLLYDRTFNDVSFKYSEIGKGTSKVITDIEFNIKKALPILFLILSALNFNIDVLNNTFSKYILFVGSIIWSLLASWNVKFSYSKEKTKAIEKIRKSLYDDEIAEHHLFEILEELKSNNKNVLIVFDELDKIGETEKVEDIIKDLKRLLLSGYANFFVVAGQGLYYQLEKSNLIDDPVISSLFSKTIHIPFLRYSALKRFCIKLVKEDSLIKEEVLNLYFDSLILESCRIPRKLSNLIRSKLIFEKDNTFITIDDTSIDKLRLDSKLLEVTNKIMDSDLPKIIRNKVQVDFFIAQIHLWLKKILEYTMNQFRVDEIVKQDSYNLNAYPSIYISQLIPLCELFFDRLIEEGFLRSEKKEGIIYYSWILEGTTTTTTTTEGIVETNISTGKVDSEFISEFVDLEKYIKGIYIDLIAGATWDNTKLSIKQMLHELTTMQALNLSRIDTNKLDVIVETRNRVLHGLPIGNEEQSVIANSQFDMARLKAELIQEYTFYVSTKFLAQYTVSRENKFGFDFIAQKEQINIVFEVKYIQNEQVDSRMIYDILDKFTNYSQISSMGCHYVLFFYHPDGRKAFDSFHDKFFDIVNNKIPELQSRFHLYYTSEYRGDANTGRLETYLGQIIEKVENEFKSREFSSKSIDTNDFKDAKEKIKKKAKDEWPDDYEMQLNEIEKQESAIKKLLEPIPIDIPKNEFSRIRDKAKREWLDDYEMRVHEEEKQVESYRKLRKK